MYIEVTTSVGNQCRLCIYPAGAPRLLNAIARDHIMPILSPFKHTTPAGEPLRGLFLTLIIAEMGILLGNLEAVAPLIAV